MAKKQISEDFFVKLYLDEINQLKAIQEESGDPTPVALQLLFAKAQLYFDGTADCPDSSLARVIWKSLERRTLDDRNHRERISKIRATARKSDSSTKKSNDNNCNQMKSNDNNCNQMKSNDTEEDIEDKVEKEEEKDKADKNTSSLGQSPQETVREKVEGRPSCIGEVKEYATTLSTAEELSGRPNTTYYGKNLKQYAEAFYNHWESTGWIRSGGLKIKDWKVAFRDWCSKGFNKPTKYSNYSGSDTNRYVLSTNVDTGDAYKDPDAFGTALNKLRAGRERNNNN